MIKLGYVTVAVRITSKLHALSSALNMDSRTFQSKEDIHLAHNQFTGTLLTELGNLVQLHQPRLGTLRNITGTIPLELVSLTRLEKVEILLTGVDPSPLPEVIALATNLRILHILDSHVTGSIPTTISHLSHLETLHLRNLDLTGTIPTEVGLLTDLTILSFYSSNLGGIPSEVGLLTKLSELEITGPSITGTLPSKLGALIVLKLLDVSETNLERGIPEEMCALNLVLVAGIFDDRCAEGENCLLDTCNV